MNNKQYLLCKCYKHLHLVATDVNKCLMEHVNGTVTGNINNLKYHVRYPKNTTFFNSEAEAQKYYKEYLKKYVYSKANDYIIFEKTKFETQFLNWFINKVKSEFEISINKK